MASLALGFAVAAAFTTVSMNDIAISHFSTQGFVGWKQEGDAFRHGPAQGDQLPKLEITNAPDSAVASSEMDGDSPTGTLTSPSFQIERDYISFLIGGGDYEHSTCLDLVVDGKVVRSATGRNSDTLMAQSWDVRPWHGKAATVRIVDKATGDWGHVNVASIVQTNAPQALPVSREPLYQERLRPQFHFTARQWTMDRLNPVERQEGWINDLNGLIYYEGEYHLFAQRWAKCWLHAVSKDLVHWTELEPAFWEESLGSGVQSGTCIVDYQNTSGFAKDKAHPAMIAFWSRFDNKSQCLCFSLDKGRTWKPLPGNPFMERPERDPKVFWYEPGKHWVMVLYGDGAYHILTSKDLLHWNDEKNPIPDSFECPDFFQLPIDGDPAHKKWVLIQGNGKYSIGEFDGKKFTEEAGRFSCDVGPQFYATQSWANVETGDGRRIQTAWMAHSPFPDMPFSQMISFPCELTLRTTPAGLRIFRKPIAELAKLHDKHQTWETKTLAAGESISLGNSNELLHLVGEVEITAGATLELTIHGNRVRLTAHTLESGKEPFSTPSEIRRIEVLIDRTSIEVFLNNGEVSSTRFALPKDESVTLHALGGAVHLRSFAAYKLKSAWR